MNRLFIAGIAVLCAWTIVDALAHRILLQPLYESSASIWRPVPEMSPVLIGAVTVFLIAVFLTVYQILVRPKSLAAGLYLGGLLGAALGASAGFGTYIHSPIPLALAWGWFILGTVKGLIAGLVLGTLIKEKR
jgi:hypothetical protein